MAETISETLDSLLAQTSGNWEAIVVDDGSTDGTASVVYKYSESDQRISLVQSNGGLSAARNTGLVAARYEYLLFLDADHWINSDYIEKFKELFEADKIASDLANSKGEMYKRKYSVRTKYLVYVLTQDNKRAHKIPMVLTLKGSNGTDVSEKIRLYEKEMSKCLSKALDSEHLEHNELDAPNGPLLFIKYPSPANRYKERKLPLAEDWIPAYEEYLSQYEPADRLFPWSPRRLEYLLEDIGNEAGLTKHLSFDMCRWTFALNDFRAGEEPDKIRQKLGVSKIQWRELFIKLKQLAGSRE